MADVMTVDELVVHEWRQRRERAARLRKQADELEALPPTPRYSVADDYSIDPLPGEDISTASAWAAAWANTTGRAITFDFNGTRCFAYPGDHGGCAAERWWSAVEAARGAAK